MAELRRWYLERDKEEHLYYDLYMLEITNVSFIDLSSDSDESLERMLDKYFGSDEKI